MTSLEKQLVSLQQQLHHLNTEVAALLALTSNIQHSTVEPVESTSRRLTERKPLDLPKAQVGINRYHQLANE
ncbi:hypothetical protein [Spirosoma validum]|uniref:Uncharacterized protein n=1 Tax=Spirosoma validum TaxID=2771355 RepID=A0A927GH65_9BACT|nr:hypothetical protein [Spirosoma validum]MBD2757601.1 hypothetical protein [Spirosoma validum]